MSAAAAGPAGRTGSRLLLSLSAASVSSLWLAAAALDGLSDRPPSPQGHLDSRRRGASRVYSRRDRPSGVCRARSGREERRGEPRAAPRTAATQMEHRCRRDQALRSRRARLMTALCRLPGARTDAEACRVDTQRRRGDAVQPARCSRPTHRQTAYATFTGWAEAGETWFETAV